MSYKYLHLIWTCIFPIIQSCTRVLVSTLTQKFNRIFVPIALCLSEFCMNIFISIFTQYCPHFTFIKTHQKLHLECNYLNSGSFDKIPQIYIYIWGTSILIKPNPTILFIFWIYLIIWVIYTRHIFGTSTLIGIFNNIIVLYIHITIRCHGLCGTLINYQFWCSFLAGYFFGFRYFWR